MLSRVRSFLVRPNFLHLMERLHHVLQLFLKLCAVIPSFFNGLFFLWTRTVFLTEPLLPHNTGATPVYFDMSWMPRCVTETSHEKCLSVTLRASLSAIPLVSDRWGIEAQSFHRRSSQAYPNSKTLSVTISFGWPADEDTSVSSHRFLRSFCVAWVTLNPLLCTCLSLVGGLQSLVKFWATHGLPSLRRWCTVVVDRDQPISVQSHPG